MAGSEAKSDLCTNEAEIGAANQQSPSGYPRQEQAQAQYPPQNVPPQYYMYQQQPAPGSAGACPPIPGAPQPAVLPYDMAQVSILPFTQSAMMKHKSLPLAILLGVFPLFGLFGAHHFYLNNILLACLYVSTMGLYGIGWLVDLFRLPCLVKRTNDELEEVKEKGYWLTCNDRFITPITRKISLVDAYLCWLPPFGLFGVHQLYVGRTRFGIFSMCSFGLLGVGWIFDFFRMPYLVYKANKYISQMRAGITVKPPSFSIFDSYLCAFPLGLFGLHHFYLGNTRRGLLYLFTLGVFGLGWLLDFFLMPMLVSRANKDREEQLSLLGQREIYIPATRPVYGTAPPAWSGPGPNTVASAPPEAPPAYAPSAAAGEVTEKDSAQPPAYQV